MSDWTPESELEKAKQLLDKHLQEEGDPVQKPKIGKITLFARTCSVTMF
jgi:hypothetical protein